MKDKRSRNFWETAFSPDRDFIAVFLIMLFITTLGSNLLYTLLTDAGTLTREELLFTIGLLVILLLIAGFIWEQRKTHYIPFHVNEENHMNRAKVVLAIPSHSDTIAKIIRYHSGVIQHIWLIGDSSLDKQYDQCLTDHKDHEVKLHRIVVNQEGTASSIYDGYKQAIEAALEMGIPADDIVIDITGGKKPMTIQAFLAALEYGLTISYVESNYEKIEGEPDIKRKGEVFQVIRFDPSVVQSKSAYTRSDEGRMS